MKYLVIALSAISVILMLQSETDPFELKSRVSMAVQGEEYIVYAASSATVDGFKGAQHASIQWLGNKSTQASINNRLINEIEIIRKTCSKSRKHDNGAVTHYDCGLD